MIVNAWVCFSLGGYVYVLFIFIYVSALFKTSSNFWMHKGSSQPSSFPSARSPLDNEGVWLPQRVQAPVFINQRTGTGQNGTPDSSLQEAHGKETADTQAALVLVQTQDQCSQSCVQIHPIILHSKEMVPLWEFTFLPVYKYLLSFPHKICMTDWDRAGILQVKPG